MIPLGIIGMLFLILAASMTTYSFTIFSICARIRRAADQYEISDPYQRKCPGNAWVLRMIAFAIDGNDQPT